MTDISKTIEAKSDQLNSDDLISGAITIEVTSVNVTNDRDQPVSIHYKGDNNKPFKPCKTVRRVIIGAWGSDSSKYTGRHMTIYRDPTVKWAGQEVGGIRISHISHIKKPLMLSLAVTRGKKTPVTVQPLTDIPQDAPQGMSDEQFASLCADGNVAASDGMDAYKEWFMDVKSSPFNDAQRQEFETKHNEWKGIASANTTEA
jgi:hypothetical protein